MCRVETAAYGKHEFEFMYSIHARFNKKKREYALGYEQGENE